MFALLVLLSTVALAILAFSFSFLPSEENGSLVLFIILLISVGLAIMGTGAECRDGWLSSSIGSRGACSWHGGVVTRYNDFGRSTLKIASSIIAIKLFRLYLQSKEAEKLTKK